MKAGLSSRSTARIAAKKTLRTREYIAEKLYCFLNYHTMLVLRRQSAVTAIITEQPDPVSEKHMEGTG
ncbi:MAG: hypothetical protein HGA72_03425 [Chlorobiaceae bacterium]|nr:hypothetical protein [Chlorobiaceae bacterium]NTW63089.1 hypothetical protein [Chlorobiaceae bacterium]